MTYNLSSPLEAQSARARLELLIKRGSICELTEKKPRRSISQNAYLHVALGYLAAQTGNTLEWVKREYYKKHCNSDLFVGEKEDKLLGRVRYIKSSAELTTEEMSLSIDRLRNWAALEAGIYIPTPEDEEQVVAMQIEVERHKEWIY
jgi:hypothetical protein